MRPNGAGGSGAGGAVAAELVRADPAVEREDGKTDLAGKPWRHDSRGPVVASGHNHDEVVAAARAVDDVRSA